MTNDRKYDIVIWGATGFTGQLVAEYLAKAAPSNVRWAIAGRNKAKLEEIRKEVAAVTKNEAVKSVDILIGDSADEKSLDAIVSQTRAIISTVGPFMKYGTPLVEACVRLGTDYVDITGETPWVKDLIDTFHEQAEKKGTLIVPCCGFDSIPSDLGTLMVVDHIREKLGQSTKSVKFFAGPSAGGVSGGTLASMFGMMDSPAHIRKRLLDPFLLQPANVEKPKSAPRDQIFVSYDNDIKKWTAPFVMAAVNTRVVRRSNAFNNYGSNFRYQESMTGKNFFVALFISIALILFVLVTQFRFLRNIVSKLLPQPGQGPSREAREKGFFHITLIGEAENGEKVIGTVKGVQDPGYGETSKMLGESALALVLNRQELARKGGVLTPATAFGRVLTERLRKAGMTFEVKPFK